MKNIGGISPCDERSHLEVYEKFLWKDGKQR